MQTVNSNKIVTLYSVHSLAVGITSDMQTFMLLGLLIRNGN